MLHVIGGFLKVVGMIVLVLSIIGTVIALGFGAREAWLLDGPSQYGMLKLAAEFGGGAIGIGAVVYGLGRLIIRLAPPLEEARFPVDPRA